MEQGKLTRAGSSFPIEELEANVLIKINTFRVMMYDNMLDNIQCEQQIINCNDSIKKIHFVIATDSGDTFDTIKLNTDKKAVEFSTIFKHVNTSNEKKNDGFREFSYIHSRNGVNKNFNPKIFLYSFDFKKKVILKNIELPFNPCMHLFHIIMEE
ncbi:hypothetical protein HB949_01610 [Listeria welshimeri]|nr:hypothetical protein [Listeria welshimeri]MBC1744139.1 hypothetical protein [Listeria welshimeri]